MRKKLCKEYILDSGTGIFDKKLGLVVKLGMKYEHYLAFGYMKHRKSIPESPAITSIPEMVEKSRQVRLVKLELGLVPT